MNENYGWRQECPKCSYPKTGGDLGEPRIYVLHDPKAQMAYFESNKKFESGDWYCKGCGFHNFARNSVCIKCETPAPSEGGGGRGAPSGSQWGSHSLKNSRQNATVYPGDWNCRNCGDFQFAKNYHCRKCGAAKVVGSEVEKNFDLKNDRNFNNVNFRPGDWECPKCQDHVFARNDRCRRCQTVRP